MAQEQKINVAELLKDCPEGMKLNCLTFDNVFFQELDWSTAFPIICYRINNGIKENMHLTKFGSHFSDNDAKCIIFPKGKTTWEEFHRPFEDGDVVVTDDSGALQMFIVKKYVSDDEAECYIGYDFDDNFIFDEGNWGYNRLATEEEKQKLFETLKIKGYKWNTETKTLESLIKPKFKDGDVIYAKSKSVANIELVGIYKKEDNELIYDYCSVSLNSESFYHHNVHGLIDKNNIDIIRLATEFEKRELFDAIKERGYKWNTETKTLEILIKPKFKVGDKIVDKSGLYTYIIKSVSDEYYGLELPHGIGVMPVKHQDDWVLVVEPKFKVGDRVKFLYYDRKEAKVVKIHDDRYELDNGKFIYFQDENAYEISNEKFDISDLKPFESRVLVRDYDYEYWRVSFFGYCDKFMGKFDTVRGVYIQCIPYEDNEHLLGTTNDCDEFYKTW